jgi:hypothetical protein
VNDLLAALGNAQVGASVAATAPTFALTPGKVGVEAIINYSTKHGSSVYKEYKAALPTAWDLKGKGPAVFIQEFRGNNQNFNVHYRRTIARYKSTIARLGRSWPVDCLGRVDPTKERSDKRLPISTSLALSNKGCFARVQESK